MAAARKRSKSAVIAFTVAAFAVVGALSVVDSPQVRAAAAAVEDDSAGCAVTLPGSFPSTSRLPDPFRKLDGTRVTSKSDWRCRRAEIKELAERYVYGDKPAKPATVTGTVSSSSISVNVNHNGRTASFSARVELPSGTGPFPAVIVVGGFGADTAAIKAAGAAVINYDPIAVGRQGTPRNNKQGAFYTVYGSSSSTGLLAAWAWGASRIIDVVEQSGGTILRSDAFGVTGCSRYGKGAFAIGALDQRIALTMPVESGTGGVPAFRSVAGESGAQPLSSAYGEQPWLGDAFSSSTGNPAALPIDTHQLVAMVAPRGLLIMENPHVDWLSTRSGAVAALGGAEVYKALGAASNISYWSDVQDGTHCASRSEWRTPIQQHVQAFLRGSGSVQSTFRISPRKPANLPDWRDWQTPTLTDGPTTTTTNTTTTTTTTATTTTTTTTPPPNNGGCTATTSVNQWTGGFVVTTRVTAGLSPVTAWTVTLTLPSGATVVNSWNTTRNANSGTIRFTNAPHNATIPAGQSVEFGFQGTGTASPHTPTCTTN